MDTIGIISAHFVPHLGGVERYTYNLARELVSSGRNVIVITSEYENSPEKENKDGIIVFRLPAFQCMNGRMPVINKCKKFTRMVREIESYKIKLLIINTHLYTLSCWGAKWGMKNAEKVIMIEHGTAHMNFGNILINNLFKIYEHLLMNYIKKRVDEYYGVSLACNEWLMHFSIKAKDVLYNAICMEDFDDENSHYRGELDISQDKIMICFVGRILEEKGIRKLCKAYEMLNKEKFCLVVAGNGEEFNELKEKYRDVKWLGTLSHDKVIELLYESDIYVLPTDYPEGFPTGVLEAAMCGCCIITTDKGGSKELIVNDDYGIIMKENTVDELLNILENLANSKQRIKKMGKNVKDRVEKNFTWNVTVKKIIEVIENEK
jgi:glycosyltransferase involved in cell wall biosynthesis